LLVLVRLILLILVRRVLLGPLLWSRLRSLILRRAALIWVIWSLLHRFTVGPKWAHMMDENYNGF